MRREPTAPSLRGNFPATEKQIAYLRSLAERGGCSFVFPATRADARREIGRLRDRIARK